MKTWACGSNALQLANKVGGGEGGDGNSFHTNCHLYKIAFNSSILPLFAFSKSVSI